MKRILSVVMVAILIVVMFCGCDINTVETEYKDKLESVVSLYPLYQRLSDKEKQIYINICTTLEAHSEKAIILGLYDTQEQADEAVKRAQNMLVEISYEHPEYFWVDTKTCMVNKIRIVNKYLTSINLTYTIDKESAEDEKETFNKKVDEILSVANDKNNLFDKVLYIYDTILSITEYDWDMYENKDDPLVGRSAYGCIVDGKTVCSGYSMAFNLFMKRLGVESGVEFDIYDFCLENDNDDIHVWNYCKLDGEYYYFDLTWDDTTLEGAEYDPYLDYSHIYFAVTKDELAKSNSKMLSDAPTPECNGTEYNYFRKKGLNIQNYSFELAKSLITGQQNQKYAAIRFDSDTELLKAENELMQQGKIWLILPDKDDIKYVISGANLHMYIFFD